MTNNEASTQTRVRILRKIRRMEAIRADGLISAEVLRAFILTMDERHNARKGGLGRK